MREEEFDRLGFSAMVLFFLGLAYGGGWPGLLGGVLALATCVFVLEPLFGWLGGRLGELVRRWIIRGLSESVIQGTPLPEMSSGERRAIARAAARECTFSERYLEKLSSSFRVKIARLLGRGRRNICFPR